jgi:hypothetical protein
MVDIIRTVHMLCCKCNSSTHSTSVQFHKCFMYSDAVLTALKSGEYVNTQAVDNGTHLN